MKPESLSSMAEKNYRQAEEKNLAAQRKPGEFIPEQLRALSAESNHHFCLWQAVTKLEQVADSAAKLAEAKMQIPVAIPAPKPYNPTAEKLARLKAGKARLDAARDAIGKHYPHWTPRERIAAHHLLLVDELDAAFEEFTQSDEAELKTLEAFKPAAAGITGGGIYSGPEMDAMTGPPPNLCSCPQREIPGIEPRRRGIHHSPGCALREI